MTVSSSRKQQATSVWYEFNSRHRARDLPNYQKAASRIHECGKLLWDCVVVSGPTRTCDYHGVCRVSSALNRGCSSHQSCSSRYRFFRILVPHSDVRMLSFAVPRSRKGFTLDSCERTLKNVCHKKEQTLVVCYTYSS